MLNSNILWYPSLYRIPVIPSISNSYSIMKIEDKTINVYNFLKGGIGGI